MMVAAEPPAAVATVAVEKPAELVVVRRDARTDVLLHADTPLPLFKAGRTEDALLRQVVFLTSTLTVVRPAAGAGEDRIRWTYQPYLQRQLCFTSITGQFSCAAVEVEELTDKAAGEAPLAATPAQAAPGPSPEAEAARVAVTTALNARSSDVFEADRRLNLDPMLKAAGVSIRRPGVPARSARR